jgi:energy-coupling factor transport system permease protein
VALRSQASAASGPRVERRGLHPGAWAAWLAGGSVAVFLTSNPLYLILGLLAACAVYAGVRESKKGRVLGPFVALGVLFAGLSVPFNVLTGSSGATELASIPELRFPSWFGGVTLGGAITAEALVSAAGRALGIATLVVLAAAFNAGVDHFRVLRLAPRALSQLAVAATIAVLAVPQALAQARAVAEAKRLRGLPARGVRALPGLLLPVLQGGLERAVQRAESLDARGFGAGARNGSALVALAGVVGLGACAWGAFAHYYYGPGIATGVVLGAGAALVVLALARGGGPATSRLFVERWTARDGAVALAAALAVALVLALRVSGAGDAGYLPYPEARAPAFHAAGALAFLLLLAPVALGGMEGGEAS